jgi:hypothetical protein
MRTATRIFDAGGASAAKAGAQLDRHCRRIRTLASHSPGAYTARVIGDRAMNGIALPKGAFF